MPADYNGSSANPNSNPATIAEARAVQLFTIGFTKKSAKHFFESIVASRTRRVVDVRLNNSSQLAGFAKKDDLAYFLKEICGVDYLHLPILAPSARLFDDYRQGRCDWRQYERQFLDLIREREIERQVPRSIIADGCLLCSEDRPHHCHRRLVAEYLSDRWGGIAIEHLV
jgi:uncharacterized protein (DUF488 family)